MSATLFPGQNISRQSLNSCRIIAAREETFAVASLHSDNARKRLHIALQERRQTPIRLSSAGRFQSVWKLAFDAQPILVHRALEYVAIKPRRYVCGTFSIL